MQKSLSAVGYAVGVGGAHPGSAKGPITLRQSKIIKDLALAIQWDEIFSAKTKNNKLAAMDEIQSICENMSHLIDDYVKRSQKFVVFGGDQSGSLGTWSGASRALCGELGLIWLDAHMDSHTVESSHSKNIHGMPLAALLGFGDPKLTNIFKPGRKLKPENICLIAARSYEAEELALLEKLNVKIFFMQDIETQGFEKIFTQALKIVTQNNLKYGISIDLDAFDPRLVPGVSVPEKNGLDVETVCACLKNKINNDEKFIGAEIIEFNPEKDVDQKTEIAIAKILMALYSE